MASRRGPRRPARQLPRLSPVAEGVRRAALEGEGVLDVPDAHHQESATAVAAESLQLGLSPLKGRRPVESIPHETAAMCAGDPDDDCLANEYVGEDFPGASSPTPDQNGVDDIGRAYGLQDEDSGSLRTSFELLQRRDRHRAELRARPGGDS